ncbi:MAG: dTDP-4-dehydrorhamnose reductase [Candidatus Aminicenantes bacterium]|jgi:dTDP-4-dehydrorhamnose reductase
MKKKKIALIGADGQLGTELTKVLEDHELFLLVYPEFDITDAAKMREILLSLTPEIIINTAAYHRVDECEDNPEKSFAVNTVAVKELASLCLEMDAVLVHFSTDYVFDGRKRTPYVEDDCPNPLNLYAVSKLAGEYLVRNILQKNFLVRTCGLFGEAGCWGKATNFVDAMVSMEQRREPIRVVNDQWVTPTSASELAQKVTDLLQTTEWGLYHMTNEGQCTWYEFARTIFKLIGSEVSIEAVDSVSYGAKALRPPYSVLENRNAKKIGITPFSPWKDALEVYLKKKGILTR